MTQNYANFDGVKLSNRGKILSFSNYPSLIITMIEFSCPHVKEISNTKLLVSLHHNETMGANLGVFEISKKDRINKIYTFEEVKGGSFIYFKRSLIIVFSTRYR